MDSPSHPRWELYRVLSEPVRLRLLALCADDELTIGELAELLGDPQPKVSRHLKVLREAGLLSVRRQGTRTLVRLAGTVTADLVVADALREGRLLVTADGSLARVQGILAERDQPVRDFFERDDGAPLEQWPGDLPAYLMMIAPLLRGRSLAVDVGTGTGALLLLLAPLFERVFAVDRSQARLEGAQTRVAALGVPNITFRCCDYVSTELHDEVSQHGGADAVFASRLLHHASRPRDAFRALSRLCRKGGTLLLLDYGPHHDERLRKEQADLWLGFEPEELLTLADESGLKAASVVPVPRYCRGAGPDAHVPWQLLVASRSESVPVQQVNQA